jgi:glycosyltransferase involved in cell wall biosynthesis
LFSDLSLLDVSFLINLDELADALISVLSNAQLKREMSKKGVEQAQKFSWKTATDEILKALK